jgi:hypothetical protein
MNIFLTISCSTSFTSIFTLHVYSLIQYTHLPVLFFMWYTMMPLVELIQIIYKVLGYCQDFFKEEGQPENLLMFREWAKKIKTDFDEEV